MVTLAWTRQRAEQLIEQQLGPQWSFAFDRARTRVGCCHFQAHRITLSRHLLPQLSPLEAEQAILHELAHALSGPRAGHGPQWRQAAAGLGYRGQRTIALAAARQQARWLAVCPRGHELRRHRRPAAGACCGSCARQGEFYSLVWRDQRQSV